MTPCLQARILTVLARTLAVAATGIACWFVALPLAEKFDVPLTDPWRIGVGLIAGLGALIVSKRALDFTQDCMTVPDVLASAALQPKRVCRKKTCRFYVPDDGSPQSKQTGGECGGKAQPADALKATIAQGKAVSLALSTEAEVTIVTVSIEGVSSSRFKNKQNGLRMKLMAVDGVQWDSPKNLGGGKRQMVGRIDKFKRESAVARLQSIANNS